MQIKTLKKLYPYLNNNIKNRKWRRITDAEIDAIMNEKQVISNCYDVAVRYSLLLTDKGREFLKKAIFVSKNNDGKLTLKIAFNIDNKKKIYRSVTSAKKSLGELIGSAVGKMIRLNPSQKPFISRFGRFFFHRYQEFNKPSNAFGWYTNKKPIIIGENNLKPNLKSNSDDVIKLLNEIADTPNQGAFVTISNHRQSNLNGHRRWHCLPIIKVDKIKQELKIINKRTDEIIKLTFDEFIKNFKAIVGIKY